jgi:hypothetical protein
VGVRIGATHDGALVFEYLHPTVAATKFSDLISPQFDYFLNIGNFHLGQGQIVTWREANDATLALPGFASDQLGSRCPVDGVSGSNAE